MQKKQINNLSKRHFICGAGTAIAGSMLCSGSTTFAAQNTSTETEGKASPTNPLYPPGATKKTMESCLQCSICIKACPEQILRETYDEKSAKKTWRPMRIGDCKAGCFLCGEVCPSGSIPPHKS